MTQPDAEPVGKESQESVPPPENPSGGEDVQLFFRHLAEITSQASRLARLKAARWKLRATWLVAAALAGLIVVTVSIAAGLAGVWLILRGLPAALADLLGGHSGWADLLSGVIFLAGLAVFVWAVRAWAERLILREFRDRQESPGVPD